MLLIKNGRLVDPQSQTDAIRDVLVEGKKVLQIGTDLSAPEGAQVIDH